MMICRGLRDICYFVNDIYNLVEILKSQTDLIVMKERDYIAGPKPNGYRSYHIILGIPVYCLDGMEYFPVEIQFRTMSMDFWASMEHRINYKKERQDRDKLVKELKEHARKLEKIEKQLIHFRNDSTLDMDKLRAMDEMKDDLALIVARGICRDVGRDQVHALVDELYDEFLGQE